MQEAPDIDPARVDLVFGPERHGSGQPQALLRRLTGRDEIEFSERPQGLPIEDSVHLAARSCLDLAGIARPEPADVEGLTSGDLNRLLIAIHRLNFGPAVDAVASCRAPGCDQDLEIDLDLDRMLEAGLRYAVEPEERIDLEIDGKACRLELALPRVRDLEAAARRALEAGPGAERLLIERALVKIARKDGKRAIGAKRAFARSEVRQRIEAWLLAHDPFARLGIRGLCPGCGAQARLTFDPTAFLVARLRRHRDILDEIVLIASHYHWGEAEILDLPIARRHAYLARIEARLTDTRGMRPLALGRGTAA
jgi:hypothetical protein